MYKIPNKHVAVPPDQLDICIRENTRPIRDLKTKTRLDTPIGKKTVYTESFTPRTVAQCYTLTIKIRKTIDLDGHTDFGLHVRRPK